MPTWLPLVASRVSVSCKIGNDVNIGVILDQMQILVFYRRQHIDKGIQFIRMVLGQMFISINVQHQIELRCRSQ